MTFKCYFCQRSFGPPDDESGNRYCRLCASENGLISVITTYETKGSYKQIYAHIYYSPGKVNLSDDLDPDYHIRLHLEDNLTLIFDSSEYFAEVVIELTGFPINPTNIKKRLPTVITFS